MEARAHPCAFGDLTLLNSHGLTVQNIQSVLSQQNAHEPAGQIVDGATTADIVTNDQI